MPTPFHWTDFDDDDASRTDDGDADGWGDFLTAAAPDTVQVQIISAREATRAERLQYEHEPK